MPLFVVTHRHPAERCPAGDPAKGPRLLRRLSVEGAERYGVNILAEAMIEGAHSLTMILEGPDHARVTEFMAPFAQGGSISVQPANHCEAVVARGGC